MKNPGKQAKIIKQRKNARICRDKKEKATLEKKTSWRNKPESPGERRKIKKISTKNKTIKTKEDIPKQRKGILPKLGQMIRKHTNNRMQKKSKNFRINYGNQVNIKKKPNG